MHLNEMLANKHVKFGTSGVRALNIHLTDKICYSFTLAFIHYLKQQKMLAKKGVIAVAGDLRPTTDHIIQIIHQAIHDAGYEIAYLGHIPTPALSYYCFQQGCPGLMVTGSHIPATMNGIKFYKPDGEILKQDEQQILLQKINIDNDKFNKSGVLKRCNVGEALLDKNGYGYFVTRYIAFFTPQCLQGMRVGIYQHSSVTYQLLKEILMQLGADVVSFGRTKSFYSLDTEALETKDIALAKTNIKKYKLDAIVSTDGDGDRPLISDGKGNWIKGDIVGLLTCIALSAKTIVLPISCNESVAKIPSFKTVSRTKIGSPYVIAEMQKLAKAGKKNIIGFEANGGVLQGSDIKMGRKVLTALPTRDSILPIICVLKMINNNKKQFATMIKQYQQSYTTSDSIKEIASDKTLTMIGQMQEAPDKIKQILAIKKPVKKVNNLDGLRIYFDDDTIVHLRPSGNAPELRCYTEAKSEKKSVLLNQHVKNQIEKWLTAG